VSIDGELVGTIHELQGGGTRFRYAAEWLARADALPVSSTLPLREEPFDAPGLHPFFENLLPEGWLLEISTRAAKVAKDDAFGLLMALCRDCIGAVEIDADERGLPHLPGGRRRCEYPSDLSAAALR